MTLLIKHNAYIDAVASAVHNHKTAVFKLALTNSAPNAATDTVWNTTVYPPPISASGYPAGGNILTTSSASTSGGVFTLALADSVFTASSSGAIGPFRFAVLYNSSAGDKTIGHYDYGSSVTLGPTDTFTVDMNDVLGTLTIA